ncbi:MAG: hypothetical protein M3Z11_00395 [Candidatus Dormibacteraeota bacterium]|nr:hypothetical protein [Candidatus Dormibacteraeota bacterium]
MSTRALRSRPAQLAIAALCGVALVPSIAARPATAATSTPPTFGNPTVSGIQGYGFEQDLRLDTHGRVYTSVPGSLGSNLSYGWRSLDGGQTFKWLPAAAQPIGKLPMCNGGGDTELATDSQDRLYINDLALANYGTARSIDHGRTLTAAPACASVVTAPDDRPWYAVDGDPMAGGSITFAYNVAPDATPIPLGNCSTTGNQLVFARSPLPAAPASAGLVFGAPQVLTRACDEGIMGNDEVFSYGAVKRAFVMHNNDALNQIRMARCDIVDYTVSPTGYANCVDALVYGNPSTVNGGDFPTMTIDHAGNLFAVWEEASCGPCPATITSNTLLYYSWSHDQGDHWTSPRVLPTPGLNTDVFAWPAAGDSGRVDVAFYGTPARQACPPCKGPDSTQGDWSLYLTQSLNLTSGNPTWTAPVLASEHFIHRGTIQTLMGGQSGDRTLGDFLQLRIGLQGEANISYADSNSATEPLASQGAFVRQNGGASVLAAHPTVEGSPRRLNAVRVASHCATFDSASVSSTCQPNLEVLGSQVALSADHNTYQVRMLVADLRSLAPKPDAGGTTLVWSTQWKVPSATDPKGGAYFHAYMESTGGATPTFWIGQNAIEATGSLTFTYPGSTQVPGSYTPTAPGTITINVPVSAVAEVAPVDNLLYSVTASTQSLTGNAETPPSVFGSGLGGNLFNLVDVAPAYDYNPALPTPSFPPSPEGDGNGTVQDGQGGDANFNFDSDGAEDGDVQTVSEQDSRSGTDFHSTSITAISYDELSHTVTVVGEGTNRGRPVAYTMTAANGPAGTGTFSMVLSDGDSVSGVLSSGSIQLG